MQVIYFIEEDKSDLVVFAYNICVKKNFKVVRFSVNTVKRRFTQYDEDALFIFSRFYGDAFDYLRSLEMTIYGPSIILPIISEYNRLPPSKQTLYSNIMANVKVCTANIVKDIKSLLFDKIHMMGGKTSLCLTLSVSVLLTKNVLSQKYLVASANNIIVLQPEWIDFVWSELESGKYKFDIFSDLITKRFLVPIFLDLNVCLSGFSVDEMNKYKKLITNNGGNFYPVMKIKEVTHLITKNNESQEYTYDDLGDIMTVRIEWITDSITKGFCQNDKLYGLSSGPFLADKRMITTKVDDNSNSKSFIENPKKISNVKNLSVDWDAKTNLLLCTDTISKDFEKVNLAHGKLFKNCKIAFVGCDGQYVSKLSRVIANNSGEVANKDNEDGVTHTILGNNCTVVERRSATEYLRSEWLDASLFFDELQPINDYRVSISKVDLDDDSSEIASTAPTTMNNETIVVDTNASPNGLFGHLSFFLDGALTETETTNLIADITELSGTITDKPQRSSFIVTKLILTYPYKCTESVSIVTEYFVRECIVKLRILSLSDDFLFTPMIINERSKSVLGKCSILITGFSLTETEALKIYSKSLGAQVQEMMADVDCPTLNRAVLTHVIANNITNKYVSKAIQLQLPVVTKKWLEKCGNHQLLVDIREYLFIPNQVLSCDKRASKISVNSRTLNTDLRSIGKMAEDNHLSAIVSTRKSDINILKRTESSRDFPSASKIPKLTPDCSQKDMNNNKALVAWGYETSLDEFGVDDSNDVWSSAGGVEETNISFSKVSIATTAVTVGDKSRKHFLFFPKPSPERDKLKVAIESLGGELSEEAMMTDDISHYICYGPSRIEQYMSAIASGKWVLHPSYVFDSLQQQTWLNEEHYEWGNPSTNHLLRQVEKPSLKQMALAAYMWRQRGGFAFQNWRVLLTYPSPRAEQIRNIFRLGGAEIVETEHDDMTHSFCKVTQELIPDQQLSHGLQWLRLEYIAVYLCKATEDQREQFVISANDIKKMNEHIRAGLKKKI